MVRCQAKRYLGGTLVVVLLLSGGAVGGQESSSRAKHAAETWLALVDGGHYGESWTSAAAYFKNQVGEREWQASMKGVRAPLGRLISRRLATATAATSLPGAPDGDYRVFQFETRFEHKDSATETVTAVAEPNGQWRITGYFIR